VAKQLQASDPHSIW